MCTRCVQFKNLPFYKNSLDEKLGLETEYHKNGNKKIEKHYKNGKENGLRTEWSKDGTIKFKGNFVDGVQR